MGIQTYAADSTTLLHLLCDGIGTGVSSLLISRTTCSPEQAEQVAQVFVANLMADPAQRYELEEMVSRRMTGRPDNRPRGVIRASPRLDEA